MWEDSILSWSDRHSYLFSSGVVAYWEDGVKEKCTLKWGFPTSKYSTWTLGPDRVYFNFCSQCPVRCIMLKVFSFRKYFNLSWFCSVYMKETQHTEKWSLMWPFEMYLFYFHITWIIYVIYFATYRDKELKGNFLELRKLPPPINIKLVLRMSLWAI